MTNLNMRRILKTPTLRMQAGGEYDAANAAKLQAFAAAEPGLGAAPQTPAGAGRGSINPEMANPDMTARPMAPPAPPMLRDGNSFGDAASFRPGGAAAAPQSNLQQYTADDVAARGAGMEATSGDWARTTPYAPPGVSPLPGAAKPVDQGAAMDQKVLASSAAPAEKKHVSRGTQAPAWTPMAMPTIGMKDGGEGPKPDHTFPDGVPAHARGLGGEVEGPKGVDPVASAYTDGEFVASNAMLKKDPGLREYLHNLRTEVLAEKGMTPEQADAEAVGGGTLRAAGGFGGVQMPDLDFLRPQAQVAPAVTAAPSGLSLAPLPEPKAPGPTTTMSNAFAGAKNLRAGIQDMPLPPKAATAPDLKLADGPYRNNSIKFDTTPQIADLKATTSPGVAPSAAPRPATPQPSITQMNQPGVDFRNAQYAERMNYEAERARIENPRSMTVKELFSRGDGSSRGPNAMRFAPAVPQTAANVAANIAASAPPVVPPDPTRMQKGLAWADEALTGLGKTKVGALALRGMNSPVGKFVGKTAGVLGAADIATYSGEAGAPTLDAERVAALSRPYDPDWKPSTGQGQAPAQPSLRAQQLAAQAVAPNTTGTQAPAPVNLGDTREVDEYAGTMQVYTKGPGGDKAGWTTVSTPAAKQARGLREQAYDQRMKDDYERATNGPNGWKTQEAARLRREEDSTPMSRGKREALTARRGQEATLQAATLQNQTSRDNNAATNQTAMRGHELDFEGKMAPVRQAARLREMNASIFKAANGNNAVAAAMAQAAGLPVKDFQDALAAQNADRASDQTNAEAKAKQGRDMFANKYFRLNSKGDEVEDLPARDAAYNAYLNTTNGKALSEEGRLGAEADAHRHGKLVRGLRQKAQDKNDSWNPFLTAQPLPTDVAPSLRAEPVGFWEGLGTGHNVKRGDHSLGNGYLPDDIDEDVIKYQLRRNAAYEAQQPKGK